MRKQRRRDLLKQIKTAEDFDKIASANNLTIHKTDSFQRASQQSVPSIGQFPEVTDARQEWCAKLPASSIM